MVEPIAGVIVTDYVKFCLERKGLSCHSPRLPTEEDATPVKLRETMRLMGEEYEKRYTVLFAEMCHQLHVTPSNAYATYYTVVNELFKDGINWGRIIALIAFAGSMSVECVEKEMPSLVDHVIGWTVNYISRHLASWIQQNGGWEGFISYYATAPTHQLESSWTSMKTVCGYAIGAISLIAFGAVLSRNS